MQYEYTPVPKYSFKEIEAYYTCIWVCWCALVVKVTLRFQNGMEQLTDATQNRIYVQLLINSKDQRENITRVLLMDVQNLTYQSVSKPKAEKKK